MKRKRIIHLDDHRIIGEGIRTLIKAQVPDCYYLYFNKTGTAFRYLVNSIEAGNSPDLLITDFAHPGLNGYEFSKSIRQLEKLLNRKPMQILLLTIYSSKLPVISKGLKENVFTDYLSLNNSQERVVEFVKGGLV